MLEQFSWDWPGHTGVHTGVQSRLIFLMQSNMETYIVFQPELREHQDLSSPAQTFSCFVFYGWRTTIWRTRLASVLCHWPLSCPQEPLSCCCPGISLSWTCQICWLTCSCPSWRCSGRCWGPTARPAVARPSLRLRPRAHLEVWGGLRGLRGLRSLGWVWLREREGNSFSFSSLLAGGGR